MEQNKTIPRRTWSCRTFCGVVMIGLVWVASFWLREIYRSGADSGRSAMGDVPLESR